MSTFEEAIVSAITAQFFESKPQSQDPNTGTITYAPSPAWNVAYQLYEANKTKIVQSITEKLDLDNLAEKMAERVIKHLTQVPYNSWNRDIAAEEFRKLLRDRTIEILAQAQAEQYRTVLEREED